MFKSQKSLLTLVVAATFAFSAHAQVDSDRGPMVMTPVTPVAPQTTPADVMAPASSVPMISGGVGEEINYMKSIEGQYNLKALFTENNGEYLAAVPVTITDSKGATLVDTLTKGPELLVTLPDGAYTITALQAGEKQEKKVTVSGKTLREAVFRFRTHDTSDIHSK
jgi:hypothetical protein